MYMYIYIYIYFIPQFLKSRVDNDAIPIALLRSQRTSTRREASISLEASEITDETYARDFLTF